MKKKSYFILLAVVVIAVILILSPGTSGISNNRCSTCHASYSQYLDILEEGNTDQIPAEINVGETKSVSISIENIVNTQRYTSLSDVSITLSSKNGRFSVATPTYNIGNLPVGTKTATWQITGVSEGSDLLVITAQAMNTHMRLSFSDSYVPSPSITVLQSTTTPTPSPTPEPTMVPTPAPSNAPTPSPEPTVTPTPSEPISTPTPEPTPQGADVAPTPTPTVSAASNISISFLSPAKNEVWHTGTENNIQLYTEGPIGPIKVTIEYSAASKNGTWIPIANGTETTSLSWNTPCTPDIYFIRAVAIHEATQSQSASSLTFVSVIEPEEASTVLPLIAILMIYFVFVAFLVILFKRRTGPEKCS